MNSAAPSSLRTSVAFFKRAREEQIVGRGLVHADADAGLVDVGRRLQGESFGTM
jgi:hypothetical protein